MERSGDGDLRLADLNHSRLGAEIYPNGRTVNYVYNSRLDSDVSRLSEMDDAAGTGAGSVEANKYLGLNTIVQRTDGSGTNQTALNYIKQTGDTLAGSDAGDKYSGLDRFGRVVDQNWINLSSGTWTGVSTDRFQYGYDRGGNVLYKNNLLDGTFSELYHANSGASGDDNNAYHNLNRITAFRRGTLSSSGNNGSGLDTVSTLNTNANSSQSWTLDSVGNQTGVTTDGTAKTNTVNSQNELTGFGSSTLAFDNNGNTTTDDQGHTLVYDARNKLVQVKNGGTTLATYGYDTNGNRIKQNDGTAIDLYNSAQGQVVEERQSGITTNQYVWSITYVNAPVLRDDNTVSGDYGFTGSLLGERLYAQDDANFNVTSLENTSGAVQKRFDYTAYGVMGVFTGTTSWSGSTNSYSWVYTFQGGRADAAVGMVHFGEREYRPTTARWERKDPAGVNGGGANLYEFVMGDPTEQTDPTGLGPAKRYATMPGPWRNTISSYGEGLDNFQSNHGGKATLSDDLINDLKQYEYYINLLKEFKKQSSSCDCKPQKFSGGDHYVLTAPIQPFTMPDGKVIWAKEPNYSFNLNTTLGTIHDLNWTVTIDRSKQPDGSCKTTKLSVHFHPHKKYAFAGAGAGNLALSWIPGTPFDIDNEWDEVILPVAPPSPPPPIADPLLWQKIGTGGG